VHHQNTSQQKPTKKTRLPAGDSYLDSSDKKEIDSHKITQEKFTKA